MGLDRVVVFASGAFVAFGVQAYLWHLAERRIPADWVTLCHAAGAVLAGLVIFTLFIDVQTVPSSKPWLALAVFAGSLGVFGVFCFVRALQADDAKMRFNTILAIASASPVLAWAMKFFFEVAREAGWRGFLKAGSGEWRALLGIGLVVVGIVLVQMKPQ